MTRLTRCPVCYSDSTTNDDARGPVTKTLTAFATTDGMSTKSVGHAYRCNDCGNWFEIIVHYLAIEVES